MGKKSIKWTAVCVMLVLSVLFGGCAQNAEPAEEAPPVKEAVTVQVAPAKKGDIQSEYLYSGKVKPIGEANVVSTVAGTVQQVNYQVGDPVEKDAVLFQMGTEDIENNLTVLQAQLEATKAQVRSAQTGVELVNGAAMQTQIQSAKTGLEQAEIAYNDMKTTYENNKQLYEAGIISKSDMDKTETGMKNAEIAYNQAKTGYDLVANQMPEENLRKAQDGLAAAQASQKAVEAQLASAEKTLRDTAVKSPITGVVTGCALTEGTLYSSAAGPAFVISDTSKVHINVSISEQLINRVKPGQKVDVKITAVSETPLQGTIDTVNPAANQTGTYEVKIVMDNADGTLKSGMFGEVHFIKEKKEDVIVLPREAVITSGGENYVFVNEDGVARKKPVTIGIDTGKEVEVTGGLEENSSVVVKGQAFLADGDTINVSGSGKEA